MIPFMRRRGESAVDLLLFPLALFILICLLCLVFSPNKESIDNFYYLMESVLDSSVMQYRLEVLN